MKKILILFIFFILIPNINLAIDVDILESQTKSLGISDFINTSKNYMGDTFGDINLQDVFGSAITGKIETKNVLKKILNSVGKESKNAISNIGIILIVIIIHSILVTISESLGNKSVSQIAYFVEYIIIITLVLNNFADIINMIKNTTVNLVGFSNSLIPLLITLMLTTGSFVSAGVVKPVLLFLINFIGNFIIDFILPLVVIGTALSIISKISNKVRIDKFAKFLRTSSVWILGVIMTLFVTILSLEGSITGAVDGVTAKTTKAAVSTVIPVVGKILGDATDAVLGCAGILKNAVGFVGVIVICGICLSPIIKLTLLSFTYYIASCICQPIADEKILGLLDNISDTFKILLAIIFCISVMLIVGLTIVIKVSNGTLLYR